MRSKIASLNPLFVMLAVALALVVLGVSCGSSATSTTAAPGAAQVTEATAVPEVAQVVEATAVPEVAQVAEGGPKYGGSLVVTFPADSGTLDPALIKSAIAQVIDQSVYDNLLLIQRDLSVKPELAVSWEANDDLSSFTFQLRKGVKFHHGKDFKAEDVLFTFNRLRDPVLDSPARTVYDPIVDIVAIDDYTVRFDLNGPSGGFLDSLSIYQARILPADVDTDRLTLEAFGTGPFILDEHRVGERSTVVRNDDYWEEGKPYLDEIVFLPIAEAATRGEALKSGDVDLIFRLDYPLIAGLEAHPDTTVLESSGNTNLGIDMNITVPPFDNKLVRQAIQAATDRQAIIQASLLGRGTLAYDHPIPPDDIRFDSQYSPPDYNIELAKSLLEQAGYPDGIDIELHTADVGAGMIEMAVALKESAAPAGIRIDINRGSADGFWSKVWNVEPFSVVYWFARPNPDQSLSIQYHSGSSLNASHYFNDEVDALIEKARVQDLEGQKATYSEIQRILIEDVPRIVPAFKSEVYGARKDVRGADPHPLAYPLFQDAWFDR